MSSTQSPFYGGNAVFKMKTPLYMQLFVDSTYNSKKTTGALQTAEFEGTPKATTTYAPTADTAANKYMTFDTPSNKYVFYTGTVTGVSGADKYISIGAGGTWTVAAQIAAIIAAILADSSAKNEITYTSDATTIVLTAVQGGYAPKGNAGDSGWTLNPNTAGAGAWVKVGVLAEDWSLNQEAVEVGTSEKKMIKFADKYAPEFRLMNVDQRAREIIVNNFSNKSVNFALHDKSNALYPTMILHDLILQDSLDLSGDTAQIVLKGSAEYNVSGNSILTTAPFWTF